MRTWTPAIVAAMLTLATAPFAHAGSLQVSPTFVEIAAPAAASSITLRNSGSIPLKAQVRVFRWTQADGKDVLEPTTDLVASPPMVSVAGGKQAVVRLVRHTKQPLAGEESYRILVDEIPGLVTKTSTNQSSLQLAFRYSVPVFAMPQAKGKPSLTWSAAKRDGKTLITAVNNGDRRVRLADFRVKDARGKEVVVAKGLAGYVLARSSMSWVAPSTIQAGSTPILIAADGDQGAINAEARAEAAR